MTLRELDIGFSSCPNDTFMFHGLISGAIDLAGVRARPAIADIEALNLRALGRGEPRLPVTKLSANALAHVCDQYTVLSAGAALGRGCGPLVVRRGADSQIEDLAALRGRTVAIPGEFTTAHLLLRTCFAEAAGAGEPLSVTIMRFDQIMPAVASGRVDAGLIIHESRFTYPEHGLVELADLGVLWEQATGLPIPLGMICAQRSLAPALVDALEHGLRRSIELAMAEPARSRAWIREHAQELDDEVCRQHIELYVNAFSVQLGDEGRAAIDELLARGRASGFLPAGPSPWR
ncbi:Menaquinone via futalosine step 4 [Enhygromyxa salina]|uniref:1,4-dihydroxy-6-naphtoate synthase n=1 Tax=Enhygromyxa salina TaxID=215803 RepID=A0A0C2CWB4_9BACT|nr:1,4-dihydroxy-6-naphthoate synthase [Enhygromyxa salina]KIG13915.1 Menaquinone via futalosine step 4 [Enhygromyxa salina]